MNLNVNNIANLFKRKYCCFLFCPKSVAKQIVPISWRNFDDKSCWKNNKKRKIIWCFLLFLVSCICFLDSFLKDSSRYLDAQACWNIIILSSSKLFLVSRQCFLQLLKKVKMLHKNANFDIICIIIVQQWMRKKPIFA